MYAGGSGEANDIELKCQAGEVKTPVSPVKLLAYLFCFRCCTDCYTGDYDV